jgi:hypothetical protein
VIDKLESVSDLKDENGVEKQSGAPWTSVTTFKPYAWTSTNQFNLGPDKALIQRQKKELRESMS